MRHRKGCTLKEQPELHIEEVETSDLVPYVNNAKLHSDLQVEQIANSIEEFGFNDPIAIWEDADGRKQIVEGHGRVLAAEKLGIDAVPVIYLNHLSDEARRAYTHIHNQTTLNSGFDYTILDKEIELLDFDWESFGFIGGFDAIEDLMGDDFASNSIESRDSGDISITFVFEEQHAQAVKDYIKAVGKDEIASKIVEEALSWA